MNKSLVLLVALVLTAYSCASSQGSLRPAQLARNFPSLAAQPLADRITPAPAVLLDDLKTGDNRVGYRSHDLTDAERAAAAQELEHLPAPLRSMLEDHVLGVSFLDNFVGGAMTWDLYDNQGTEAGFWLVFNGRLLTQSTSQWLTFRDNSAFTPAPGTTLTETALPEVPSLRFLLTHEAAHVFDFVHGVTPMAREIRAKNAVTVAPGDFGFGRTYPLDSSWHFYDLVPGTKPAATTLAAAFDALSAAGSPSLYGSQTALEDWAELVAYGVLSRDAGVTITLRLATGDAPVRAWSPTGDAAVQLRIAAALSRLEAP